MGRRYTTEEVRLTMQFHKELKRDYAKLYRRWELTTNEAQKEAMGKRLLVKAAHLGKLSDEIKQLTGSKTIGN